MLKKIKDKLSEIILAGEEFLEAEFAKAEQGIEGEAAKVDKELVADIQVHLDDARQLKAKIEELEAADAKADAKADAPETGTPA